MENLGSTLCLPIPLLFKRGSSWATLKEQGPLPGNAAGAVEQLVRISGLGATVRREPEHSATLEAPEDDAAHSHLVLLAPCTVPSPFSIQSRWVLQLHQNEIF